jgi:putative transposase
MKKKRFSEEQIVEILAEAETGISVTELCRKHNVSGPTFYEWRKKFGGMTAADVRELKTLRTENQRLKKLLAEKELAIDVLKDVNSKKW